MNTTTLSSPISTVKTPLALVLRHRLAHHVARLAKDRGITPSTLAAAAVVPVRTVERILAEQDNTPLDTLTALARALDVAPTDLLAPLP